MSAYWVSEYIKPILPWLYIWEEDLQNINYKNESQISSSVNYTTRFIVHKNRENKYTSTGTLITW